MPPPFRCLSIPEFVAAVDAHPWTRRVWRVDVHHTWHPDHARWREIGSGPSVDGMFRFHVEGRGFEDIAQHVSIMPDGTIWTGRDWNRTPASVGAGMNGGVFMLEIVGNFDEGRDALEGAQLAASLSVVRAVQRHFGLPVAAVLFHREVPQTEKTCPGTGVSKPRFLAALRAIELT